MTQRRSALPLLRLTLSLVAVGLVVAACGDDDPVEPGNPQDISITVSPSAVTLAQGQETDLTVTLESTGGYTETVTVFVEDAPAGVSGSTETIDGGSGTTTLTLDASLVASIGTGTVTVTATGPGVASASTTSTVEVTYAGGLALSVDPNPVGMTLGGTETATVGIARFAPFTGPVELAVGGAPEGLTVTLDSTLVAGDSTVMTLVADTALALEGRYTLLVRGLGEGVSGDLVGFLVTIVR
jgi:hypothetical protein